MSAFKQFHSSELTKENVAIVPDLVYTHRSTVCLSDVSFTASNVAKYLSQLNVTKARGLDNIHPVVLHECADIPSLACPRYSSSGVESYEYHANIQERRSCTCD